MKRKVIGWCVCLLLILLASCSSTSGTFDAEQEQLFRDMLPEHVILNGDLKLALDHFSYTVPTDWVTIILVNETGHPIIVSDDLFGARGFVFDESSQQWEEIEFGFPIEKEPTVVIPVETRDPFEVSRGFSTMFMELEGTVDVRLLVTATLANCDSAATKCPVYGAYADAQLVK